MNQVHVIIVGGMAAGCKVAARLSRLKPDYCITILEKSSFLSFGSCGLPFFASGDLDSIGELAKTSYSIERNADYFKNTLNVDAYTNTLVLSVIPEAKEVVAKNVISGEKKILTYDFLIFATGTIPKKIPFKTADNPNISLFLKPKDAIRFRNLAQKGKIGKCAIIGAGFIGCELAEAMTSLWGINTLILEKENEILTGVLDNEMASIARKHLVKNGIKIRTGVEIEMIYSNSDNAPVIKLKDEEINSDYVFVCCGVRPDSSLAEKSGIEIGNTGAIKVNEYLETNIHNVFACGDCIEPLNIITGKPFWLSNGSLANRQARIVANNIADAKEKYTGTVNTFSVKLFGLTIASAGLTTAYSEKTGFKTKTLCATFYDRPHYHFDSKFLFTKIIYEESTLKLIGLQLAGIGEVTRYIDVFSELLQRKSTVSDLLELEHAYTPSHSSPISPLNNLGAMVLNIETENIKTVPPDSFDFFGGEIIDLREKDEIEKIPLNKPSIQIPVERLRTIIKTFDPAKEYLTVCQIGQRSYEGVRILTNFGFKNVKYLEGGLLFTNSEKI